MTPPSDEFCVMIHDEFSFGCLIHGSALAIFVHNSSEEIYE